MMVISRMKTMAYAALLYAIAFAVLHSAPVSQARTTSCEDAPGMEGCSDESTPPSSSSSAKKDGAAAPVTMKLHQTIAFDEPKFVEVDKDLVLLSDDVIDTINMHFVVHEGATLTFRAPAVKIARNEVPAQPLFKLSGTVRFQPTGSAPVLLDGSLKDEWDVVQRTGEDGVFLPDRGNIVRYHRSGITVSRMKHTGGDLDGPRHEEVELSPELQASLAAIHTEVPAGSDVPSSTFFFSHSSTFSSASSSATPTLVENDGECDRCLLISYCDTLFGPGSCPNPAFSPEATAITTPAVSSSPASEAVDDDGESDVCLLTHYFDTVDGPGSCPNPAFSPADTATADSPGNHDEAGTHTAAKPDCNGNTSGDCTSTESSTDSNNGSDRVDQEQAHGHDDGSSNNSEAKPDETESTTSSAPPTPTASNLDPSFSTVRLVPIVGDDLKGIMISSTGMSAIWIEEYGAIGFEKLTLISPDSSGDQTRGHVSSTILLFPDSDRVTRVIHAREVLLKEAEEGNVAAHESKRMPWGWVWLSCRGRLHKDVERARGRMGEVEMTLTDRAGLEVTVDGTRVLSKSGRFSREWMNRFPWRRSKNTSYELHVTDDGIEVRLGEKVVWGVTADEMNMVHRAYS